MEFEQLLTDLRIEIVEIDAVIGETSAKWRAESIERVKAGLTAKNQVPTTALSSKLKTLDALIAASCMKFDPPAVLFTQNVKDFEFTVKGKKQNLGGLTVESLKLAK